MEELEQVKKINCYQCKNETDKNEFFPFCCSECKEEWNAGRYQSVRRVPKTIAEMQARLKEMSLAAHPNQVNKIGGGEVLNNENIYDVAKLIFG